MIGQNLLWQLTFHSNRAGAVNKQPYANFGYTFHSHTQALKCIYWAIFNLHMYGICLAF